MTKTKIKIQTTEAGVTVTLKYPEDQAKEVIKLWGEDVELIKARSDQEELKPDKQALLENIDREITGVRVLLTNIEHLLAKEKEGLA